MCLLAMCPRKEGTRASLGGRLLFIVWLGPCATAAVILGIPKNLAGKAGLAVVASVYLGLQEAD